MKIRNGCVFIAHVCKPGAMSTLVVDMLNWTMKYYSCIEESIRSSVCVRAGKVSLWIEIDSSLPVFQAVAHDHFQSSGGELSSRRTGFS